MLKLKILSITLLSYLINFSCLGMEEDNISNNLWRDVLSEHSDEIYKRVKSTAPAPKQCSDEMSEVVSNLPLKNDVMDYSVYIPPECWVIVFSYPEICREECGWSYSNNRPLYSSYCTSEFLALRTVNKDFCNIISEGITNLCLYDDKLERLGGLECFPASLIDGCFRELVELRLHPLKFVPHKRTTFKLNSEKNVYDLVPDETDRSIEGKLFMNYLFFIIDGLKIQKLTFYGDHVAEFYENLGKNTTLTSLTLVPWVRPVADYMASQYLTNNTTLTRLTIRWEYEPEYSIVDMLVNPGFEVFKNLTEFCMQAEDENINDVLESDAISSIFNMFSNLRSLTLKRFSSYIEGDWMVKLTNSLRTSKALTHLALVENQGIGASGAKLIGDVLGNNTILTHLNLQDSDIGNSGAASIANSLSTNTTLCSLNLAYNLIENDGAQAFSMVLNHNTTLTELDLHENFGEEDISDDLLQEINGLLERNKKIQKKKMMAYRPSGGRG